MHLRDFSHLAPTSKIRWVSIVFTGSILAQFPPLPKSLIKLSLFFKKSWHHSLIQKLQLVHDGLAFIERISFVQYCCCNPNVQMLDTQKIFFHCSHSWQWLQTFIELFHFRSWHRSVIPKMRLSFCQQRGEEPDSFWLKASVLLQHSEWLWKQHWNCLRQLEFKVHYKSWRICCVCTFLRS